VALNVPSWASLIRVRIKKSGTASVIHEWATSALTLWPQCRQLALLAGLNNHLRHTGRQGALLQCGQAMLKCAFIIRSFYRMTCTVAAACEFCSATNRRWFRSEIHCKSGERAPRTQSPITSHGLLLDAYFPRTMGYGTSPFKPFQMIRLNASGSPRLSSFEKSNWAVAAAQ
jgi:hypothetical protein